MNTFVPATGGYVTFVDRASVIIVAADRKELTTFIINAGVVRTIVVVITDNWGINATFLAIASIFCAEVSVVARNFSVFTTTRIIAIVCGARVVVIAIIRRIRSSYTTNQHIASGSFALISRFTRDGGVLATMDVIASIIGTGIIIIAVNGLGYTTLYRITVFGTASVIIFAGHTNVIASGGLFCSFVTKRCLTFAVGFADNRCVNTTGHVIARSSSTGVNITTLNSRVFTTTCGVTAISRAGAIIVTGAVCEDTSG